MKKKILVLFIILNTSVYLFAESIYASRMIDSVNDHCWAARLQKDSKDVDCLSINIERVEAGKIVAYGSYCIYMSSFSDNEFLQILKKFDMQARAYDIYENLNLGIVDFDNIASDLTILIDKFTIQKYGYLYANLLGSFELEKYFIDNGVKCFLYTLWFPK